MLMGKDEQEALRSEMEELNPESIVFEEITGNLDELEFGTQVVNSRLYCSWFGFKGGQQQSKVANFSAGGEHKRVQLPKFLKAGASMIILDDPTNGKSIFHIVNNCRHSAFHLMHTFLFNEDLDVETLHSLEEALLNFAGCV